MRVPRPAVLLGLGLVACAAPPSADEDPTDTPDTDPPAQDTAPPVSPSGEPATVEAIPFPACDDPSARATLGPYTPPLDAGDWALQPWTDTPRELFEGGGVSAADVDGDDDLDLLLTTKDGVRLYLQTGPLQFTDATDTHLPADQEGRVTAVVPADPDGDGDPDLLVNRYRRAHSLWRNAGDGTFTDVTEAAGLSSDPTLRGTGASWADVDGDGDLDLFVPKFGPFFANPRPPGDPSALYLSDGDGTFTDVSTWLPQVFQDSYTFVGAFVDLDDDDLPELYGVHDFGHIFPNRLLRNTGAGFVLDEGAVGLDVSLQGMGYDQGDLDGDGHLDLAMAGWGNNRLMMGTADGLWFDAHVAKGFDGDLSRDQVIAWSAVMDDLDHDGRLDLVQGFGHIYNQQTPADQPDEIYHQQPDGQLQPVGEAWGFDHPGQTRGVLVVDLDGDGWLDLVRQDLAGPATLQRARCGTGASVIVSLSQPGLNRDAIGARVTAVFGDRRITRRIRAGGRSVLSAGPPQVHLGLGEVDRLDALIVRWPDGATTTLPDVPTRRRLRIDRSPTP